MALARLAAWFIEEALPRWARVAFDGRNGHFVEALQLDGTAESTGILRTRTAARQIYVFAHAAAVGVAPPGALDKAERAFERLKACAWITGVSPGYAKSFNRLSSAIIDGQRDLYDHACVLLALGWLYKATNNADYCFDIDETLAAIDTGLAGSCGGWAEDSEGAVPRRQNPHMHFFEACLALLETTGSLSYAARSGELFMLFRTRFFDEETGVLREFFGPAWECAEVYGSNRLEPGHMVEWVSLIRRYAAHVDCADADLLCEKLLANAILLGSDKRTHFLLEEVSPDGTALKPSRRLWAQVELLKALLAQHRAYGDDALQMQIAALEEQLFASYLAETPAGTWRDCFNDAGKSIAKTIPASSLYHLWTAVVQVVEPPLRRSPSPSASISIDVPNCCGSIDRSESLEISS